MARQGVLKMLWGTGGVTQKSGVILSIGGFQPNRDFLVNLCKTLKTWGLDRDPRFLGLQNIEFKQLIGKILISWHLVADATGRRLQSLSANY